MAIPTTATSSKTNSARSSATPDSFPCDRIVVRVVTIAVSHFLSVVRIHAASLALQLHHEWKPGLHIRGRRLHDQRDDHTNYMPGVVVSRRRTAAGAVAFHRLRRRFTVIVKDRHGISAGKHGRICGLQSG